MNSVELSIREAKWDNVRCLLIFCVVIGHVLYRFIGHDNLAKSIYFLIYTFHMPVFIFISGMFSKKAVQAHQYEKILFYTLVYIVMKFLQSFAESFESGKISFRFFWEAGPGWYAFAMAVYYLVSFLIENFLKDYDKRKLFVLALIVGVIWGFDDHMGDHFCSARILNFYPFFVLGSCFESKRLMRCMRSWKAKISSALVLLITIWISFFKIDKVFWMLKLLKGKYPFADMEIHGWEGVLIRLSYYCITIVIGWAVMTIISEKKSIFSYIGKRTLPIFVWHTFVIIMLLDVLKGQEILQRVWPIHYIQGFILFACIIVMLCSSYIFEKMTQFIACFTLDKTKMTEKAGKL